ncbi:acetylornithine aminotransferase [Kineosphaera limosa]|uniref:Acetylornithine aminotransferase n=1 Tax=Kineosphaera limosa NBRC 100340 TaxID=1184609 RepID=K6WR01_9MICO|nr:acetylornithine transaminase [Kineosphaera limosa]NYD99220.1 acetylornithine aminotransferase [Kineosphaera limosa]GAB96256.1 acetylornithine aminotransferase [Kineosphaera limosa NBRC 100340]
MSGSQALLDRYEHSLLGVFGRPKLVLERGAGDLVWDVEGRRYLDLVGGLAVNSLGHANPQVAAAVAAQAHQLMHVSNFFTTPGQVELAERILGLAQAPAGSGVFFTNSGTEAIEAAIKLARRTGRTGLLATTGAFHGRSTGALALTHKPAYREPFDPLLPGVLPHVPYNDPDALRAVFAEHGDQIGAFVVEPVQGEAGVLPADPEYLRLARALTTDHGALLIVDEIQSGIGRTGVWFAHERAGIVPDAMTLAKGLGGGFPIGALVTYGPQVTGLLTAGQHGTTFGGNPLACAAGLAVLTLIERDGVLDHVNQVGAKLRDGVLGLGHDLIDGVRGHGLLLGIGLRADVASQATALAQEAGFIVNPVRPDTIRLAPSLLLEPGHADEFVAALPGLLDAAAPTAQPQPPSRSATPSREAG